MNIIFFLKWTECSSAVNGYVFYKNVQQHQKKKNPNPKLTVQRKRNINFQSWGL